MGRPKLSPDLRHSYAGHFLRRHVNLIQPRNLKNSVYLKSNPKHRDDDSHFSTIKYSILRLSFLSTKMAKNEGTFFDNCSVDENRFVGTVDLTLSPWFVAKRMNLNAGLHVLVLIRWPKKTAELFLKIIKPDKVKLFIWKNPERNKLLQMYNFSEIFYNDDLANPNDKTIQWVQNVSNFTTNLVCFPRIMEYRDHKYVNIKRIIVPSAFDITPEFLHMWKDNKWPATCLVLRKNVPDLKAFYEFGKIVSHEITDLWIPFEDSNFALHPLIIKQFRSNIDQLKKNFPNLKFITATYRMQFFRKCMNDFAEHLQKEQIQYLIKSFTDSLRPEWCKELRVLVKNYVIVDEDNEGFGFDYTLMNKLHEEIATCREEFPLLKRICLRGAAVSNFDCFSWRPCCAIIEMETRLAQFEIVFKLRNGL